MASREARKHNRADRAIAMTASVETLPMVVTDSERDRAAAILLGSDRGAAVLENIRNNAAGAARSPVWASLYAEIVGWTGTKSQILAWMVAHLGVSLLQAQQAVRQVQQSPRDPHEIARTCREYLNWYDGPNGPGCDSTFDASGPALPADAKPEPH